MRVLPLLFLLLAFRGHAQYTHVWKGTADNQWNNAANWQPATVPTASSKVKNRHLRQLPYCACQPC